MATTRVERLFAAVDIGSSKISALIAGQNEDGSLTVLGTGQRESRGVRRGYVADVDACELAVRHAVEQAERVAGTSIDHVWVGFSAGGLQSHVGEMEHDLGGHRVEQEDIDELLTHSRAAIDPDGKLIMHAQPAIYTIDGLQGVDNPIGLHADRLGVHLHVVLADPSPVRNIEMAVASAHLGVKAIVATPLASGLAVLTEEERDLGVALVEMGAAVTNLSVWRRGKLIGIYSIPYGAGDITDDVASAFGIRRGQAERVKCFHGSAQSSPRDNHDTIEFERDMALGEEEPRRITRAQLISVIRNRLDHMTRDINAALRQLGFSDANGRLVVLSGGGAELTGIADYMQAALGHPVRIGRPLAVKALPEAHSGPAFAALVGLVRHAAESPIDVRRLYWDAAEARKDKAIFKWRGLLGVLKESF